MTAAGARPSKVADASAIAAVLFGEPEGARMMATLDACRLNAPFLLDLKLANVLLKKIRRTPSERDRLAAAFGALDRLDIRRLSVDRTGVFILAERTGLSAYDASYLWLSLRLGAELITLDRRLAQAARLERSGG